VCIFLAQLELVNGFWAGNSILVSGSDKTQRSGITRGNFFKKQMECYKCRSYRQHPDGEVKEFGLSGLADGYDAQKIRQHKKKKGQWEWKNMVASQRGPQPMPETRPTKIPRLTKRQSSPRKPRRYSKRSFSKENTCTFRCMVTIGVPLGSTDGRDRWILQIVNDHHSGHFPHMCYGIQSKPFRMKSVTEVNLSVQVRPYARVVFVSFCITVTSIYYGNVYRCLLR
jgi:hypothetical protein